MSEIMGDTGNKDVPDSSILFRVRQFIDWRRECESIDLRLAALSARTTTAWSPEHMNEKKVTPSCQNSIVTIK
jgi:hypothetical protein